MVETDKQARTDEEALGHQFDRLEGNLPDRVARVLRWIREPASRWVRIPLGIVLIAAGLLSFMPLLGIWMLPLGLLLLAQDLPFLRRPMRRVLLWIERRWDRHKRGR
jgi:hypothetical protein